jgi:hypothetical protein
MLPKVTSLWPECGDSEPGTLDSCRLKRGHPGSHRSPTGAWGDDSRRIEDLQEVIANEQATRARIREAVETMFTDYIGPEGRGAAAGVQREVLQILDREWGS